jgi:hypothetical protein
MLKNNLIRLWKSKGQIIEGITNSIFKREDVEMIAEERMKICRECPSHLYDEKGEGCMVIGTGPCCDMTKGGCGCSLGFKTRSLSAGCELGHWNAELSDQEEDLLNEKLAL